MNIGLGSSFLDLPACLCRRCCVLRSRIAVGGGAQIPTGRSRIHRRGVAVGAAWLPALPAHPLIRGHSSQAPRVRPPSPCSAAPPPTGHSTPARPTGLWRDRGREGASEGGSEGGRVGMSTVAAVGVEAAAAGFGTCPSDTAVAAASLALPCPAQAALTTTGGMTEPPICIAPSCRSPAGLPELVG